MSLDDQLAQSCGGDDQLIISCLGDDEIFFIGNISLPAEIIRAIHLGGTGLGTVGTTEAIRKRAEYPCQINIPFIKRLFSTCKVPDNDICDDGEWFLIDDDCELDNTMFFSMWFLRILLILSIIFLLRNNKYLPTIIIVLVILFYINGAFSGVLPEAPLIETREICTEESPISILLSTCKIENNGVCDYGEYPLINKDCGFTAMRVTSGRIFQEVWILRLLAILSIIFLIMKKKRYLLISSIFFIGLLVTNSKIIDAMVSKEVSCEGINYLANFGPCIAPNYPTLGWLLGLIIILLVYFSTKKLKRPGKSTKQ